MRELTLTQYAERYRDRALPSAENIVLREAEASDFALSRRDSVAHKYRFGRALVIAGSRGYSGAPVLAANACERGGAGLTHLMVPESIYEIAAARCDGAAVTPLPADGAGGFSAEAVPRVLA